MSNTLRSTDYTNESDYRRRVEQRLHESAAHFSQKVHQAIKDPDLPQEMLSDYLALRDDYQIHEGVVSRNVVSSSVIIVGRGGVVIPGHSNMVSGGEGSMKLYPYSGYMVQTVLVNGVVVFGLGNTFSFQIPEEDFTIRVTFVQTVLGYDGEWEDGYCVNVAAEYTAWWSSNVCNIEELSFRGEWSTELCTEVSTLYLSRWTVDKCVQLEEAYKAMWGAEVCAVKESVDFIAQWTSIVCVDNFVMYVSGWSGDVCTEITTHFVGQWGGEDDAVCVDASISYSAFWKTKLCVII